MKLPVLNVGAVEITESSWLKVLLVLIAMDACMWLFGVSGTLIYILRNRALPELGGIRLLSGPFEALGMDGIILTGILFIIVSTFKLLALSWLNSGRKEGAVLELVLLGLSAIFWYGFALPLGPIIGILQLVILVFLWKSF